MRKKLLFLMASGLCSMQAYAQFPAPYCPEDYPSNVEPITLVDFAGISNTSSSATGGTVHEDYTAITGNVTQGSTYTITIEGNTDGSFEDYVSVFIDWDQDGSFSASETYDIDFLYDTDGTDGVSITGSILVPMTAMTGATRMRVSKLWNAFPTPCNTGGYGQAEDYTLNVSAASACTGTPAPGTASGPAAVCDTTNFTLTVTGYSMATGLAFQWQSSTDGITFTNIPSATMDTYTGTQPDSMYYQVVVTCTASGMSDVSNIVFVDEVECVCVPSYTTGTDEGDYIGMVQVGTINNVTTGASSPYYTLYTTPTTSLMKLTPYTITLSAGTYTTNDIAAWIDYNQDGVFDVSEKLGESDDLADYPASDSYSFTIPASALTGETILRVREVYGGAPGIMPCTTEDYGETEDYVITVLPAPPCVNPPAGGTISGPAADSAGNTVQYVLTGENGDQLQWFISYDGGMTYAAIDSATNDTLNYMIDGLTSYSLYAVLSSAGCTNDTSNVFTTNVISNDLACNAFPLVMGVNGPYTNVGATVDTGEVAPMGGDCQTQQSWCNNSLENTIWFTFTAPSSGRVSIQAPGFDDQLAVWKANNCADLNDMSAVEFISANDDDSNYVAHGGAQFSSFINGLYCLIPGQTYYLQLDGYFDPGVTQIILTDIGTSPTPVLTLSDQEFCSTVTLDAMNASATSTYLWSNGDVTQTSTYTATGTVWVTVTDSLRCTGSDTATITDIYPAASFTPTLVSGATYNFTSTSYPAGGASGTTYAWDFGDGGTSTSESSTHTYTANGTYTVTLTVTNACGSNVVTQSVTVTGLGISDSDANRWVQVYPNPSVDQMHVKATSAIQEVYLVDAAGKRVQVSANVNSTDADVNVSSLARGMYTLHVVFENGIARRQISLVK